MASWNAKLPSEVLSFQLEASDQAAAAQRHSSCVKDEVDNLLSCDVVFVSGTMLSDPVIAITVLYCTNQRLTAYTRVYSNLYNLSM